MFVVVVVAEAEVAGAVVAEPSAVVSHTRGQTLRQIDVAGLVRGDQEAGPSHSLAPSHVTALGPDSAARTPVRGQARDRALN